MSSNITTKICVYGCGLNLYWNKDYNEYWEVFTKKKHICPNRSINSNKPTTANISTTGTANKPNYYSKKPWSNTQQPKPKMSNSFELLHGPIDIIQKKY